MFKNAKDPKKAEQITSIIAIVVIVGVVLFFLRSYIFNSEDADVTSEEFALVDERSQLRSEIGQKLFETLGKIDNLKLDTSMFSEGTQGAQAFASLIDFETEIPARPIGKENPFSPLPLEKRALITVPAKR